MAEIFLPTGTLPVKATTSTSGCPTNTSATSEVGPSSTLNIGPGSPDAWSSSAKRKATSGVFSEGLRMMGVPAAMAGPSLWATWFNGWLNGVMATAQRNGSRVVKILRALPCAEMSHEKI